MSKDIKLNKVDFGVMGNSINLRNPFQNHKPKQPLWRKLNPLKLLKSFFKVILKTISGTKNLLLRSNRLKWKISRSIFLGRGVYFKYISNFSIIIVLIAGFLVYTSYDQKQGQTSLSKYASIAEATYSDMVLAGPSSETYLASRPLKETTYSVQPGDTLSSIAKKFSTEQNEISVDSIRWANPDTTKNDNLKPGTILTILPVSGTRHVVKKGETLEQIAKKYKLIKDGDQQEIIDGTLQRIVNTNLLDVDVVGDKQVPKIVEGAVLIIPDGVIIPDAPKVAVKPTTVNKPNTNASTTAKPANVVATAATGSLIWPVEGNKGLQTDYYRRGHEAVDIADRSGPQILAQGPGTVTFAGWSNGGGGWQIEIEYDFGLTAIYAHTCCNYKSNTFKVGRGDRVYQGQPIAIMGSTGNSTGPHLHYSLYDTKTKVYVNPLNYITR